MTRWISLGSLVSVVLFIATVGSVLSTDEQIHSYLKMPDYIGVVPEHIESTLLERIPFGSTRDQVKQSLRALSIGTDSGSACGTRLNGAEFDCRLGINHHSWELLRETCLISFQFGPSDDLRLVTARQEFVWL
jgi:hypothetical protein